MNSVLLFEVVVSVVVQVTVLILVATLLERQTRSSRTRCRIWTAAFVATQMLLLVAFVFPHVRWCQFPIDAEMRSLGNVLRTEMFTIKVLAGIWLVGFFVSVVWRTYLFFRLQLFLNARCRDMEPHECAAIPEELRHAAPEGTRWFVSTESHGPFCWQMHRPTIVLPFSFAGEHEQTRRHILKHELEHLRTGHPLQHFLQGLCGLVFWFHPCVYWAARRAELSREFWCDEVAAGTGSGVAGYLRSLATIAERNIHAPRCTLGFGQKKHAIVRRSERLVALAQRGQWRADPSESGGRWPIATLLVVAIFVSQLWLPVNVLASGRSSFSPWPTWTASALHDLGLVVRDYEQFEHRREAQDMLHPED